MPGDFGDESGEKLFDWMLRVGEDASETAMLAAAQRLKSAFKNLRGDIAQSGKTKDCQEVTEWAKLKLEELQALPEYSTLKEAIAAKLSSVKVEHDFFTDERGKDFLLFRVKDAPDVSRAFSELECDTDRAFDMALASRGKTREQVRDAEPLDERAASAKKASKALDAAREHVREIELSEVRTK